MEAVGCTAEGEVGGLVVEAEVNRSDVVEEEEAGRKEADQVAESLVVGVLVAEDVLMGAFTRTI